ncbi:hypothetical protein TSOC_003567 [Tetrabaena socialis]|uniref:BRO1 domain-containing protein n=1 Tax=Tetrabaena socialis TaxID=47790 RepID=A0A2J8AB82_9CHLO|nr:hypothetical protein TSOC_003567 [Tetrabaena socialis]|eukprot:PNH09785.1 hypothetical protein TSOC_003567 [Tetrabaena socialis]
MLPRKEAAVVYTATAAAVRQSAHQRIAEAASGGGGGGDAAAAPSGAPAAASTTAAAAVAQQDGAAAAGGGPSVPTVTAAAVAALRRAAGVYGYLAEQLLPELGGGAAGGAGGDRPLELLPAAARCMQALCLAEAQALMAAAAAAKGMSAATQRALHAGAVVLLRSAEEAAREAAAAAPPGLPLSDRLLRLLAASAAAHSARAHHCMALERQKEMELGEAEACCEECQRLLEGALRRVDRTDPASWAEGLKAQQTSASRLLAAVHKDRLGVTYQSLPKLTPDATANPAVRVAPDPFRPAAVRPLAPTAEQAKSGCALICHTPCCRALWRAASPAFVGPGAGEDPSGDSAWSR